MRKPKIIDFDDPYHRNGTLQLSENDIISIGYEKSAILHGRGVQNEKNVIVRLAGHLKPGM